MSTTTHPANPFHDLVDDLLEASAAFRVDYLHHKLTGAKVVLEDDAADGLADLLELAAHGLQLLLKDRGTPHQTKEGSADHA
jgi:hypothetical protein